MVDLKQKYNVFEEGDRSGVEQSFAEMEVYQLIKKFVK